MTVHICILACPRNERTLVPRPPIDLLVPVTERQRFYGDHLRLRRSTHQVLGMPRPSPAAVSPVLAGLSSLLCGDSR
ncbi:hypothetical protein C8Q74DRAFT_845784 [Fomes fomentarius]|nr:hypothetical protein C8Q74DRAFT_845784 [Fomes fomentarius]